MAWPAPIYSRNQVRKSGKAYTQAHMQDGRALVGYNITTEDFQVIENWRASHGAVLNTAQAWLRRLAINNPPVVGQRLKRFSTIVDKLTSGRAVDLSTMNDIAGVRAIFRSESDLRSFQEQMIVSRAKHEITHDLSKYDYIVSPKDTGYRGVHQVYRRNGLARSGEPWNGLKFEVQLRTAIQHSWATAIEIYDSTKRSRFKFEKSNDSAYEQFLVIAELFARVHEGRTGSLSQLTDLELVEREEELELQTHMVSSITSLVTADNYGRLKKNTILRRTKTGELYVYQYESLPAAIRAISEIEDDESTDNAVLVGAQTPNHIRVAFKNYFDDTSDFVDLLAPAKQEIRPV